MAGKKHQRADDSPMGERIAAINECFISVAGVGRELSESFEIMNRQVTENISRQIESQATIACVFGELIEQRTLSCDWVFGSLIASKELGSCAKQWQTTLHSLGQISSGICSSLESIGPRKEIFPSSNAFADINACAQALGSLPTTDHFKEILPSLDGLANIGDIAQAVGLVPRTGHFTQAFSPLDAITNISSIVQELASRLVGIPPLPVIRLPRIDDDWFIAQSATNDATVMLSPNASKEERSAAWKSLHIFVREWLHIDHRQFRSDSGTHQVINRGGEVTIYTPWDRDFAISDVLEIAAKLLVFGRWQETDSPRAYLHVAVTSEVRRHLDRQEKKHRLLQNVGGTDLEIVERLGAIVLDTKAEPVGDVSELIGELCALDPEANEIAIAKYVHGVPVADLPVHLGWPERKTKSVLRRVYRRIEKSRSSKLAGSTALQSLRPPRGKRSRENIVLPTVPPKVGDFYCAGGTVRWERLNSGRHVWTHDTGAWPGISFDKPKKS